MDNNPNNMQNMSAQQPMPGPMPMQNMNMQQPMPGPMPKQYGSSVSIKSIILTVTSAIGSLSFFLPWVMGEYVRAYVNGTDIGASYRYMGYFTLILFTVSATIAATKIMDKLGLVSKICISAMSGIAAILSLVLVIIMTNEFEGYAVAGVGLYLCIIMGIASAAVSWIPIKGE